MLMAACLIMGMLMAFSLIMAMGMRMGYTILMRMLMCMILAMFMAMMDQIPIFIFNQMHNLAPFPFMTHHEVSVPVISSVFMTRIYQFILLYIFIKLSARDLS